MCLKRSAHVVPLSQLLVLPSVLILIVALTNGVSAQSRSEGTDQASGLSHGVVPWSITSPAEGSSGRPPSMVVPFLFVTERYDSNVLLQPTNVIADYVTNITAGARVNHSGDMVVTTLSGGFTSEVYALHPGLNYIGTNGTLNLGLDNAVGKVVRGLRLSISDTVVYTPRLQGWLTPEAQPNSFVSGVQTYRTNSLTNISNVLSAYALSPVDQIRASYSYQMLKFYNTETLGSGVTGGLFNTNVHIFSTGLEHNINPTDSIVVSYQYQHMLFELNTGGPVFDVAVNGAMVTLKKSITREWSAEVSPGAAIVSNVPEGPQWTMQAALRWNDARLSSGVAYNRSIVPGFFVAGAAMVNNIVSLFLSRNITSQWNIGAQANYGLSNSLSSANGSIGFESYGGRGFVNYGFYPGFVASVIGTYDKFTFNTAGSGNQSMDRQTVMLSLTAEWN